MGVLVRVVVWLNTLANAAGAVLLAPLAVLPGWLSVTVVAVASGVGLLVVFKHTSNQRAIRRVRDDIDANLLALKLFPDSVPVTLRAQGRLLWGAARLLVLGLAPTVVMALPVTLVLAQLSLWYEQRPLRVGEEAVVTLTLNAPAGDPLPEVGLDPPEAVEVVAGPVRVPSKREVCWNLKARQDGTHRLAFSVSGQAADKELAVGDGYLRVSARRPAWSWSDALLYPREPPLPPEGVVRSIDVQYPARPSWAYGTGRWVVFWFVVSLAAAFAFRRLMGVNV
jgi:hypothetical protein